MKFLNYIHNFRGVAILYVVVVHCVSAFDWEHAPTSEKFLRTLFGNGTVLFVFIGGYLFQYLLEQYRVTDYLVKKLQYVGLPYLICSVPAIVFFVFFQERPEMPVGFYDHSQFYQIIMFYLTGLHLAPYWFIPMIFLFYAISPLLALGDRNQKIYYFLPVFIAISLIIPRSSFVFSNFAHFFSVYLCGMFFSHYRVRIMEKITHRISIILMLLALIGLSAFDFYIGGHSAIYLQKLVLSFFYLALLYKFDMQIKTIFSVLANLSFSIYFIHSYIISTIKMVSANKTGHYFHGTLINFLLFSIFIVAFNMLIAALLKKALGRYSRYIIGS